MTQLRLRDIAVVCLVSLVVSVLFQWAYAKKPTPLAVAEQEKRIVTLEARVRDQVNKIDNLMRRVSELENRTTSNFSTRIAVLEGELANIEALSIEFANELAEQAVAIECMQRSGQPRQRLHMDFDIQKM